MDGHLDPQGMIDDLDAMRTAGIAGAIYLEVGLGLPEGDVRVLTDRWLKNVTRAFEHARSIGIEVSLASGPGWCGAGGPWVEPENAMQFLVGSETHTHGPRHFNDLLAQPPPRTPFFGQDSMTPSVEKQWREFYRDERVLAFPTPRVDVRVPDIAEKALYTRASFSSHILGPYMNRPFVKACLTASAKQVESPDVAVPGSLVQDISEHMDEHGRLNWAVPAGEWTIIRFGRTLTGQTTRPAAHSALGLETNKFSVAAIDAHFRTYIAPIITRCTVEPGANTGLSSLHFDSWEMGSQNWSADFKQQFANRRGYKPDRHLPCLLGYVIDSEEASERFLWDIRQTANELVLANHVGRLRTLAHAANLKLTVEPYDLNPSSDLELGSCADVPMGEFWSTGYTESDEFSVDTDYSVIEAVSVAHTNGKNIVAAESFTAMPSELWRQHPAAMKDQTDWAFCAGVNRLVFHRFQAQPTGVRPPGMTMGPAGGFGVHWDRTQPWWDKLSVYHGYIARCQYLLRMGQAAADILFLIPEGAPTVFLPPPSVFWPGRRDRRGYGFDGCSPRCLIERASVRDRKIIFPDGMRYSLLVLPRIDTMTPQLLEKIKALVQDGAKVLGDAPVASPSLEGFPDCDQVVRKLANELWSTTAPQGPAGRGEVFNDNGCRRIPVEQELAGAHWISTREAGGAPLDIVFAKQFELADIESICDATILATASYPFRIMLNGLLIGEGHRTEEIRRWDISAGLRSGENEIRVIVTPDGHSDHETAALAAIHIQRVDRDVLRFATDHSWSANNALQTQVAVEIGGFDAPPWHLTVRNIEDPPMYAGYWKLDHTLRGIGVTPDFEGGPDFRYIHRQTEEQDIYFISNRTPRPTRRSCKFRVTRRAAVWYDPIRGDYAPVSCRVEGEYTTLDVALPPYGSAFVIFSQREFALGAHRPEILYRYERAMDIEGPWALSFALGNKTVRQVSANRLFDWSTHDDPQIRYFSGRCRYRCVFQANKLTGEYQRIGMGLIRDLASVKLNGRELGVVWCAPWEVDVPVGCLKSGTNLLEIEVSSSWHNRLAGDSALPPEQRTTWTPDQVPLGPDARLESSGLLGPVCILTST